MFESSDIISTYTREEALNDGVLIDLSEKAKESGFKVPFAVTDTLFNTYLNPSKELQEYGQSLNGRMYDMFFMLYLKAQKNKESMVLFTVLFLMHPDKEPEEVSLKSIIGPGDTGEAVITIMMPNED
jgi:Family of unknown function (DUF6573)